MSNWTYSGNPGYSAKDQVRFLIGDTDSKDPLLLDGEIEWVISQYSSPLNAAIRCCETILAKLSRLADETVGSVSISFSQQAKGYRALMADLRARIALEDGMPYAGGISRSDKQAQEQNMDRVRPDFTKHMMENKVIAPWTTQTELAFWLEIQD